MKVLFVVQGEGRGHLTQAISMERLLMGCGHEVVEVLVGKREKKRLPGFFSRSMHAPIKHFESPNFLPTQVNKRANIPRSVAFNVLKLPRYFESMLYIRRQITESGADLVINFYELLTGLTYALLAPEVPYICIGHQYLFLHPDLKLPEEGRASRFFMNMFTRVTSIGAKMRLALSFRRMEPFGNIKVVPPLLRQAVFTQEVSAGKYIHGYMVNSGFSESVKQWHKEYPEIPLRFFWDRWEEEPVKKVDETLSFYQLDDEEFLRQMSGCKAFASTAGFESVCEAMYLGKPILMVPAHIEQECNAFDAMQSGAGIADDNFRMDRLLEFASTFKPDLRFRYWAESADYVIMDAIESILPVNYAERMYMVEEYV